MSSVQTILYAHGFEGRATGPKAQFLKERIGARVIAPCMWSRGWTLDDHVQVLVDALEANGHPDLIVGSSMGGFAAALALQFPPFLSIPTLLLAPAFGIHTAWRERLGTDAFTQWSRDGSMAYFHSGAQRDIDLPFGLWTQCCEGAQVIIHAPTVIIHGIHDTVVPIQGSYDAQARSPGVRSVLEVEAGHQLNDHLDMLIPAIATLGLS